MVKKLISIEICCVILCITHTHTHTVDTIEDKLDMLKTTYDTPQLREEMLVIIIIYPLWLLLFIVIVVYSVQLVADTAQLAKIANKPIQNLRLKSRDLAPVRICIIIIVIVIIIIML